MRKCQKFSFKLVVKSALLGAILKNQLIFVSAVVYISRIGSAVRHCACNPLSQNTIAHITAVAMDYVICLGRRSRRAFFAFSSFFNRLLSANSTQHRQVFPSRIKDGELEMDIARQKSSIYFVF